VLRRFPQTQDDFRIVRIGRGVVQSGEDVVVIEKRLIAMGGIYVAVGILAERTDIERSRAGKSTCPSLSTKSLCTLT